MAATIHVRAGKNIEDVVDVVYGATIESGAVGFVDFKVYKGKRPTTKMVRVLPFFSEVPFAPRGAMIYLKDEVTNPLPFHDRTMTIESIRIHQNTINLASLSSFQGERGIRLQRVGDRSGRTIARRNVIISGW